MGITGSDVYFFTVCQLGAENALKEEIAREHAELRFAFSRPGFITFKWTGASSEVPSTLNSVFARAWGISVKKLSQKKDGPPLAESEVVQEVLDLAGKLSARRFHVWQRDLFKPGEEPLSYDPREFAAPLESLVRKAERSPFSSVDQSAKPGDLVLDLIWIDPGVWWLGYHVCVLPGRSGYPGGKMPVVLPPEAPSRAFLKLEEAIIGSQLPVRSGDVAVEIGSAPGGASYALLKRGVNVHGIDVYAMDKVVMLHTYPGKKPWFRFTQQPIGNVMPDGLPEDVHWLLLDMNVAPKISLFEVDRLATLLGRSLLGLILTVKLNDWKIAAEIPSILEHVRALGMVEVIASQLPSNRQEFCVTALTRAGLNRRGSS
ncbi:MAG: SAM-dependent methyltransferase [Bdellovibrionota bacterium]